MNSIIQIYHHSTHSKVTKGREYSSLPSLYSLRGHKGSRIFEFTITLLTQRSRKVENIRVYHHSTHSEVTKGREYSSLPSLYSLRCHERSRIFEFTITLLTQMSRRSRIFEFTITLLIQRSRNVENIRVYHHSTHSKVTKGRDETV